MVGPFFFLKLLIKFVKNLLVYNFILYLYFT